MIYKFTIVFLPALGIGYCAVPDLLPPSEYCGLYIVQIQKYRQTDRQTDGQTNRGDQHTLRKISRFSQSNNQPDITGESPARAHSPWGKSLLLHIVYTGVVLHTLTCFCCGCEDRGKRAVHGLSKCLCFSDLQRPSVCVSVDNTARVTVTTLMWVTARYAHPAWRTPLRFVFIFTNIFTRATVPCLNFWQQNRHWVYLILDVTSMCIPVIIRHNIPLEY